MAKTAKKLAALATSADPVAAAVSLIVFALSVAGVPSRLGLDNAAVTAIGSAVILVAAAGRAIVAWWRGVKVSLQDPIAAALSAVILALSILGVPNAAEIDADTIAILASSIVSIATMNRAQKSSAVAAVAAKPDPTTEDRDTAKP